MAEQVIAEIEQASLVMAQFSYFHDWIIASCSVRSDDQVDRSEVQDVKHYVTATGSVRVILWPPADAISTARRGSIVVLRLLRATEVCLDFSLPMGGGFPWVVDKLDIEEMHMRTETVNARGMRLRLDTSYLDVLNRWLVRTRYLCNFSTAKVMVLRPV